MTIDCDHRWRPAPTRLILPGDEVQLWRVPLEQGADRVGGYAQLLSVEERERAARFHFERDRRRFIVSHGALRQILGCYLEADPAGLRFTIEPQGKPRLAAACAASGVQFSLTHSHELAVCAIAYQCAVGVDVEQQRTLSDLMSLAARYFADEEYAALRNLPVDQQSPAFFKAWTCKEAYLKATGQGLAHGLKHVPVMLQPGKPAQLRALANAPQETARWSVLDFEPAPQYHGAVVFERESATTVRLYAHI